MNTDKLKQLARDLRKARPHSPRDTLGGFVIAARMLDKARADLLGINGEYNFYPCGLGAYFWKFTGLGAMKFKEFVGTGAADEDVDRWIRDNTTQKIPRRLSSGIMRCAVSVCATSLIRCRNILKLTFRNSVIRQVK
jgi:hypothetical protein